MLLLDIYRSNRYRGISKDLQTYLIYNNNKIWETSNLGKNSFIMNSKIKDKFIF